MTSTIPFPADIEVPALRARDAGLHWSLIARLCICIVPAMAALGFGHLMLGARYLALSLFISLGYLLVKGDKYEYLALVIGALPAMGFFREVFFYFSIFVFLGGGLLMWACVAREDVKFVWRDLTWRCLVFLSLLYWWLSVLHTGDYTSNARLLDYILSGTAIYLVADRRSWLATALVGLGITSNLLALSLLPYGDRLGAGEIDSMHVGNPILMGVPSAMVLLLALADNGRLLMLENHPVGRMLLALASGESLVLSGSRGSWAVTTVCMVLLLSFSKLGRKALLGCVAVISLATVLVLFSDRGAKIQTVFEKTVDSDRTLKNRTSFRSVQWAAIPQVFVASPIWGWGPGSGKNVAFLYTGRHLAWHALYLQVIGETGLLGLICLLWILGSLLRRGIVHLRRWGEITPLVGVVAYMALGMSVSGFDALSGIFLGLTFMARERAPRLSSREIRIGPIASAENITPPLLQPKTVLHKPAS
jgi:O-antigen ligase